VSELPLRAELIHPSLVSLLVGVVHELSPLPAVTPVEESAIVSPAVKANLGDQVVGVGLHVLESGRSDELGPERLEDRHAEDIGKSVRRP